MTTYTCASDRVESSVEGSMLLKTYTKVLLQRHIPATTDRFSGYNGYVIAAILLQQHGCAVCLPCCSLYTFNGELTELLRTSGVWSR